jgi:hypothetical protein
MYAGTIVDAPKRSFYYAANTASHSAGAFAPSMHSLPRLTWPLWIRRSNSIPAMVIAVVLNRLRPCNGPSRSSTPR